MEASIFVFVVVVFGVLLVFFTVKPVPRAWSTRLSDSGGIPTRFGQGLI